MERKRLRAAAPAGPARAASACLGVGTSAVSEEARGENPLSAAAFSIVWRRRWDLAAGSRWKQTAAGGATRVALFQREAESSSRRCECLPFIRRKKL